MRISYHVQRNKFLHSWTPFRFSFRRFLSITPIKIFTDASTKCSVDLCYCHCCANRWKWTQIATRNKAMQNTFFSTFFGFSLTFSFKFGLAVLPYLDISNWAWISTCNSQKPMIRDQLLSVFVSLAFYLANYRNLIFKFYCVCTVHIASLWEQCCCCTITIKFHSNSSKRLKLFLWFALIQIIWICHCLAVVYTNIHVIQCVVCSFKRKAEMFGQSAYHSTQQLTNSNDYVSNVSQMSNLYVSRSSRFVYRRTSSNNHSHDKQTKTIANKVVLLLTIFSPRFRSHWFDDREHVF